MCLCMTCWHHVYIHVTCHALQAHAASPNNRQVAFNLACLYADIREVSVGSSCVCCHRFRIGTCSSACLYLLCCCAAVLLLYCCECCAALILMSPCVDLDRVLSRTGEGHPLCRAYASRCMASAGIVAIGTEEGTPTHTITHTHTQSTHTHTHTHINTTQHGWNALTCAETRRCMGYSSLATSCNTGF